MTIKEICETEDGNTGSVILHAEGIFWRAYERSAFLFHTGVRPMAVTVRTVKSLGGRRVLSLGFPMASSDRNLSGLKTLERKERELVLESPVPFDGDAYTRWRAAFEAEPGGSVAERVLDAIRSFDVSVSTPLDAFRLIVSLKEEVR